MDISNTFGNELANLIENKKYDEIEKLLGERARDLGILNHIYYSFHERENEVYIVYNFKELEGVGINKGVINLNSDGIELILTKLLDDIKIGTLALDKLNSIIKTIKDSMDGELNIQYNWGTDKYCSVKDWDYRNIKIKISKITLDNIIRLYKEDNELTDLTEILKEHNWKANIIEFVNSFNDIGLHQKILATVDTLDIDKILVENMLNTDDVVELIRKNKNNNGKQRIKSVSIIKELGAFVAIVYWDVDYKNNKINYSIQDEKVMDIENKRFVSDYSIYTRLEHRIFLPEELRENIFNSDDLINIEEL